MELMSQCASVFVEFSVFRRTTSFPHTYKATLQTPTRNYSNYCNSSLIYTACPTRYRTPHFYNNFTINEDIAGGPLLRVATIRRTTDTHYKHIPLHFSHNERTPVQISLQYLHAGFGSEWDTLYICYIN